MIWRTAVASFILALAAPSAFAAWPSSGLPIATGPAQQQFPVGVSLSGGDLLVFWNEFGQPFVLRAQRVTIEGTLASGWPAGGRGVISAPAAVSIPELTPDGMGGFLLAWYDYRGTGARGIYGIRIDANGV